MDDALIERCRQQIIRDVQALDLTRHNRRTAEFRIQETARDAICKVFEQREPSRRFKVTERWPRVACILKGESARLEVWIGDDLTGEGDLIDPFDVVVRRERPADKRAAADVTRASKALADATDVRPRLPLPPAPAKPASAKPAVTQSKTQSRTPVVSKPGVRK